MDICTIYYNKGGKELEYKCSAYSLNAITEELKKQGAKVEEVVIYKKTQRPKKEITRDEIDKRKYYNSRYKRYYILCKRGDISQETFNKIKEFLKSQKKTCKNKEQFEINFKKYIKALNL